MGNGPNEFVSERDAFFAGIVNVYNQESTKWQKPFLLVDRPYLENERRKKKEPFIARPPTWADVVHGEDATIHFIERDEYRPLLSEARSCLLEPLHQGADHRLPALFVTGPPGSGKSTLVRRVASTLVECDDVLVADLGTNHGPLLAEDSRFYLEGLAELSESGRRVVLLMDDPFFVNSGWNLFLQRIARPGYSNIAVFGATPTYLYRNYARKTVGGRVNLSEKHLGPTSENERAILTQMYGAPGSASAGEEEDLLVFAMETASGESFDSIIERIWSTLNEGIPVEERSTVKDLAWTVKAFLIVSYLHRFQVLCPEPLLRATLQMLSANSDSDYLTKIRQLALSEGWHIFRVHPGESRSSPHPLVGSMHARVAERAWRIWPAKAVDPSVWVASASVEVPDCASQMADFLIACNSTIDPRDREFVRQLVDIWTNSDVSTAQLCALVRKIRTVPSVAEFFIRVLRKRMRRDNEESWLAAIELIELSRPGSPPREVLENVRLPACLRLANLAADSTVAVDLLQNSIDVVNRSGLREKVFSSLRGKLDWQLDENLLVWVLNYAVPATLIEMLPTIFDWLEENSDAIKVRVALLRWYKYYIDLLGTEEMWLLLDELQAWRKLPADDPDDRALIRELFGLARRATLIRSPSAGDVVGEILHRAPAEGSYFWACLLRLIEETRSSPEVDAAEVIAKTRAWLHDHPDDIEVRRALINAVKSMSGSPAMEVINETRAWLHDHPDDNRVRIVMLDLVGSLVFIGAVQSSPAMEVIAETRAWLHDHPEDPDGPEVRRALLDLVGSVPGAPVLDVITETRTWIVDHPDDTRVATALENLPITWR